jgi:hypothetical protein
VLLLDEPLSALDAKLRAQMQFELSELQDQVGITFITVTHDQDEALSMAGRIAVMNKGEVAQMATPSDLYEYPRQSVCRRFRRFGEPVRRQADASTSPTGGGGMRRVWARFISTTASPARTAPMSGSRCGQRRSISTCPARQSDPCRRAGCAPEDHNLGPRADQGMSYLGDITLFEIKLETVR